MLEAEDICKQLIDLSAEVKKSLPVVTAGTSRSKLDQQVEDLAAKCSSIAKDLAQEVAKLKPGQRYKSFQTVQKLIETIWKRGKIEKSKTHLSHTAAPREADNHSELVKQWVHI